MRRAISLILIALPVAALLPLRSDGAPQRVTTMNGIGLIDYTRPARFKVGDWVKYRVTGSSELGEVDAYDVTVLIAGAEKFWGDDCFWVETWTEAQERTPIAVATLMSYSAFSDTAWLQNFQKYARKMVHEVGEDGTPLQTVMRRTNTLNRRDAIPNREVTLLTDTLGADTVHVAKGLFHCTKISMRQGVGMNAEVGDSTIRNEVRENRTLYYTLEVPITSVAREDIENVVLRKTWRAGESDKAVDQLRERAIGIARLVDFGSGGLTPLITPEYARRGIAGAAPAAPARVPARKSTKRAAG
jgi:predicted ester cyclase